LNREIGDPVWLVDSLLLKSEILLTPRQTEEARRCVRSAWKQAELVPRSNTSELERLKSRLSEVEEILKTRK
jgi:hypothetical protein